MQFIRADLSLIVNHLKPCQHTQTWLSFLRENQRFIPADLDSNQRLLHVPEKYLVRRLHP
jgi:hypothetical protein